MVVKLLFHQGLIVKIPFTEVDVLQSMRRKSHNSLGDLQLTPQQINHVLKCILYKHCSGFIDTGL